MDIPVKTMRITLRAMMESLFDAFFPEYSPHSYEYSVNEAVKALSSLCGPEKAGQFRERIPVLAELLAQDVEAIGGNDPAASDTQEIVYCYPAVTAMVHYRVAHELEEATGLESRVTVLGYLQRGGTPSPYDRVLSTRFGTAAADFLAEGKFGKLVAMQNGSIVDVPLSHIAGLVKNVPYEHPMIQAAKELGTCFGD